MPLTRFIFEDDSKVLPEQFRRSFGFTGSHKLHFADLPGEQHVRPRGDFGVISDNRGINLWASCHQSAACSLCGVLLQHVSFMLLLFSIVR